MTQAWRGPGSAKWIEECVLGCTGLEFHRKLPARHFLFHTVMPKILKNGYDFLTIKRQESEEHPSAALASSSDFCRPILPNRKAQLGELVTKITMSIGIEHCYCSAPTIVYLLPAPMLKKWYHIPRTKEYDLFGRIDFSNGWEYHLSGRIEHGHGRLLKKYAIQSKAFRPAPTIVIAFTLLVHRLIEKELWFTILLMFPRRLAIEWVCHWYCYAATAAIIWVPNSCFSWIPPK